MITGFVQGQVLRLSAPVVAADTLDYLTAQFVFRSADWSGMDKWAHFAKGGTVYDVRLTEDKIQREDHLNLGAGEWKVYIHGNRFADGTVVERITTAEDVLRVVPTGALDGEPFPEMPASVTEQILARLENVEQNGGGDGSGGVNGADGIGIVSIVQTTKSDADNGVNVLTITLTNGSTHTFEVQNGSKGSRGEPGAPGKDYVLTEDDKTEIAEEAAKLVEIPGDRNIELIEFITLPEDTSSIVREVMPDGTYYGFKSVFAVISPMQECSNKWVKTSAYYDKPIYNFDPSFPNDSPDVPKKKDFVAHKAFNLGSQLNNPIHAGVLETGGIICSLMSYGQTNPGYHTAFQASVAARIGYNTNKAKIIKFELTSEVPLVSGTRVLLFGVRA